MKSSFFISLLISLCALQATASLLPRQKASSPPTTADSKPTTSAAPPTSDKPNTTKDTPTPATTPPTSAADSPSTSNTQPTSHPTEQPAATPPPQQTTAQLSTIFVSNSDVVVTQSVSATQTSSSSSSTSTSSKSKSNNDDSNDSGGLGTGSIIGLSVAGGVAVLGIIAFFVWKFTRKRFSDFDDNEAIKWPDLNNHGNGGADTHPLPVKNTGRSGFDTGSEGSLSRVESANYSTQDFQAGTAHDPYAVPPLPHLNPNQPYQDDPTSGTGYYDPYRGPVPGSIEHGTSQSADWTHHPEAIPMTQLGTASGRMSPGPQAAYGMDPTAVYDAGRQSPSPYAAYGGRAASPGPQAAYSGRMSPGPQVAYHHTGGTPSPSPAPRIQ